MPTGYKRALLLFLPVVVLIWFIGWSLYWIGLREEAAKPRKIIYQKELTLSVVMPKEKCAT
jgi:hypothetical protein